VKDVYTCKLTNCVVENGCLTPQKSALLDSESNERLLYIPAS
jgi:hypothetical protein